MRRDVLKLRRDVIDARWDVIKKGKRLTESLELLNTEPVHHDPLGA